MKSKNRPHTILSCNSCSKEMRVRNDYVKKHSGTCISCQKIGNKQALKHGDNDKRLYRIWAGLKHRRYTYQVSICGEWANYSNFKTWAMCNNYADNLTIDRIDNTKGYSPENCQWISLEENAGKDKRIFTDVEKINIFNKRKELGLTQVEMAKKLNVSRNTIQRAEKYAKEKL